MKIGSTPRHEFIVPFHHSLMKDFKATYSQGGRIVLEKHLKDFDIDGDTLSVKLTQEETFRFAQGIDVEIQGRVLTMGGDAIPSDIEIISAEKCLDREVLK